LSGYRIKLDIFAGPLDLLLYLVRKEEVDIYDIPIAKITDQYVQYIEMLKSLDINLAGDFLVMAATLMQIKSAMLLPQADPEEVEGGEAEDPRAELIRQLLEYKKFKDTANLLEAAAEEHKQRFARPDSIIDRLKGDSEPELDMDQVSVWDLLEAFDAICRATGNIPDISHIQDDTPIDLYQIDILNRLQTEGQLTFERVFEAGSNRLILVGMFLALLELIRDKLVWAEQDASSSKIFLKALTDEPAEQAVQRAIIDLSESGEAEAEPVEEVEEETEEPPIPIQELPAKDKRPAKVQTESQEPPIPIAEIPRSGRESDTIGDEAESESSAKQDAES
jgi:segregation and condensation protein A